MRGGELVYGQGAGLVYVRDTGPLYEKPLQILWRGEREERDGDDD